MTREELEATVKEQARKLEAVKSMCEKLAQGVEYGAYGGQEYEFGVESGQVALAESVLEVLEWPLTTPIKLTEHEPRWRVGIKPNCLPY